MNQAILTNPTSKFSATRIPELLFDYQSDEESKNIAFIKLYARISTQIDQYQNQFCQLITGQDSLLRRNLIQFLKLMTTLQYFDFSSKFAIKVFQALVSQSKYLNKYQLEIASIMLTNQTLQNLYFGLLIQCFGIYDQQMNFSIKLLERILSSSIQLLSGKIKGPPVTSQSIQKMLNTSMFLIKISIRQFKNQYDHENFLLICCHSLEIMRKFASRGVQQLAAFNMIWKKTIQNFESFSLRVVDALFGMMAELCNFKHLKYMQQFEQEHYRNLITHSSTHLILQCPNINKFWHTYLKHKSDASTSTASTETIPNHTQIISLFTQNMHIMVQDIKQLEQKLKMVDSLIIFTQIMTKLTHFNQIMEREKLYVANPENNVASCKLVAMSFQVLYSPFFRVQNQLLFLKLFEEFANLKGYLEANPANKLQECMGILSSLPALKTILSKSCEGLFNGQNFKSLLGFLFNFLDNQEYSKCFQDLIIFVCARFEEKYQQYFQLLKSKALVYLNDVMLNCLNIFLNLCQKPQSIKSFIKCIECLDKFLKKSGVQSSFLYSKIIIKAISKRNKTFDKQAYNFLSKTFKASTTKQSCKLQCFQSLYNLILTQNRVLYLQLLFDFAQAHSKDKQISTRMQYKNQQISYICLSSPSQSSQLRNLKYLIMIQNMKSDITLSQKVFHQIYTIIQQRIFTPKLYTQIVQVIHKQICTFQKACQSEHRCWGRCEDIVLGFVDILRKMVLGVNRDMEQSQYSKIQNAKLCKRITNQMLQIFIRFNDEMLSLHFSQIIKKLKQCVSYVKERNFSVMSLVIRTLTICYSHLQSKERIPEKEEQEWVPSQQQQIQKHNLLQVLLSYGNEQQIDKQQQMIQKNYNAEGTGAESYCWTACDVVMICVSVVRIFGSCFRYIY